MIDPFDPGLITFAELARRLPRDGRGRTICVGVIRRWAAVGTVGGVRLDSALIGGRRYTTEAAARVFFAEREAGRGRRAAPAPQAAETWAREDAELEALWR